MSSNLAFLYQAGFDPQAVEQSEPTGNLVEFDLAPAAVPAVELPKMSVFKSCKATSTTSPERDIDAQELIEIIRGDDYRAKVEAIRQGNKALKNSLPAITASGTFAGRAGAKLIEHSGILLADIDLADNPQLALHAVEIRKGLMADSLTVFGFESPSGGLKVGFRVEADGDLHKASFEAVKAHLRDAHGLIVDESGKDVSRLCFLSHDPEAWVYDDADILHPVVIAEPETRASGTVEPFYSSDTDPELVRSALMAIPTRPQYHLWIRIAASVWDLLGETEGTALLQEWSPEESPGEYAKKFRNRLEQVRGGTLFHIAKEYHGWQRPHGVNIPEVPAEMKAFISSLFSESEVQANDAVEDEDIFDLLDRANIATKETLAERRRMEVEAKYAMQGISLLGEWLTIYARYTSGKTLLTLWLIIEAIKRGQIEGKNVYYLNADDTFTGTNDKGDLLEQYGIREIVPGTNDAPTCEQFIELLAKSKNPHGKIVILDTLKKFTDLMDKKIQKRFGENMRRFISAGGTLICLAHTNKHKDGEGKSIASGTSDISDDCDCKFMLDIDTPKEADDRQVTFTNDKPRGPVEKKVTFKYDASEKLGWLERFETVQRVSNDEAEATVSKLLANDQRKQDQDVIEYINGQLMVAEQSERDLTQLNLAHPDSNNYEEMLKTGSRAKRKEVLHRYDQSNPDPIMRYWLSFRNSKGGTSYKLQTKWDR